MPGDDNVINISSASVLDLKAELYKKEEEFKKQKAAAAGQAVTSVAKKVTKKEGIWSRQNKGVAERATRDKVILEEVEGSSLEASRKAMERKAKLYDKLRKHGIEDDTLAEEVLVDFDSKPWDDSFDAENRSVNEDVEKKDGQSANDPWVEYVDEFGRTRVVRKSELPEDLPSQSGSSEDEEDSRFDEEQRRWEQAALSELQSGPIHYDDTREIRTKGVGFYRFSRDEAERQTQMQALKEMRQETEEKRALRQTIKQKRKSLLDERLALIRAKKQARSKPADDQHSSNTSMTVTDDSGKGDTINKSVGIDEKAATNEAVGPVMDQVVIERAVNELLSNIRRKVESEM